jgi:hypothetical protein
MFMDTFILMAAAGLSLFPRNFSIVSHNFPLLPTIKP